MKNLVSKFYQKSSKFFPRLFLFEKVYTGIKKKHLIVKPIYASFHSEYTINCIRKKTKNPNYENVIMNFFLTLLF